MIDAGSQGSRMHIYEWEPRILRNEHDVQDAVAGNKLSFPGTDTRWTERLHPGIATFGSIQDDTELERALADYLSPLLNFATTVLHTKRASFHEYPIFLRATAGMRILDTQKYV
jgi:Golgi nucleoside diphosphatase